MRITMRWYGTDDPVALAHIQQVPVVQGVVSALYNVPTGHVWDLEAIQSLKQQVAASELTLDVIESIPIHDAIKLGTPERDQYIEWYCESIKHLGQAGVGILCYNFMPVFDWMRTDLDSPLPDGSTTLTFSQNALETIDLAGETVGLPGWGAVYTPAELQSLITQYQALGAKKLFENLIYFLEAVVPVAETANVRLAIHPDDPPWSIFGIPRIVSTADDLKRIFDAVPSIHNGLTFCSGSFSSRADNNLPRMIQQFAERIHFVHLRSVARTAQHDFYEAPHNTGDTDIPAVVKALVDVGFDGVVRPDHGRMIWGETGRAGYGLYDRALGAMYIAGLLDGYIKR